MRTFVYIISDGEFFKIGATGDVKSRLLALRTANARKLVLASSVPFDTSEEAYRREKQLHECFGVKRARGEWFQIDMNDIVRALSDRLDAEYWTQAESEPGDDAVAMACAAKASFSNMEPENPDPFDYDEYEDD